MQCILVQNALRFDAKCGAFWCKMQSKMVQNAMQNAAKRERKSIKIHCNGIINPFRTARNMAQKGKISIKK